MKWKYYPLAHDDAKAKEQVLENLSMGAMEHTLTKKLLARFSETTGVMFAIAFESLDLDQDWLYKYGTYDGGKGLSAAIGTRPVSWTDSPRWGLIEFVNKWLGASRESVVLCENLIAKPIHLSRAPRESRISCYGEEVYHILTSEDAANEDAIETALRESEHHWATGVCSSCVEMPQGDIRSEAFFDAIVASTKHIFVPALDNEGYLVWSPGRISRDTRVPSTLND